MPPPRTAGRISSRRARRKLSRVAGAVLRPARRASHDGEHQPVAARITAHVGEQGRGVGAVAHAEEDPHGAGRARFSTGDPPRRGPGGIASSGWRAACRRRRGARRHRAARREARAGRTGARRTLEAARSAEVEQPVATPATTARRNASEETRHGAVGNGVGARGRKRETTARARRGEADAMERVRNNSAGLRLATKTSTLTSPSFTHHDARPLSLLFCLLSLLALPGLAPAFRRDADTREEPRSSLQTRQRSRASPLHGRAPPRRTTRTGTPIGPTPAPACPPHSSGSCPRAGAAGADPVARADSAERQARQRRRPRLRGRVAAARHAHAARGR